MTIARAILPGHRHIKSRSSAEGIPVAEQHLAQSLLVALAGALLDKDDADLPGDCAVLIGRALRLCRDESWVTQ